MTMTMIYRQVPFIKHVFGHPFLFHFGTAKECACFFTDSFYPQEEIHGIMKIAESLFLPKDGLEIYREFRRKQKKLNERVSFFTYGIAQPIVACPRTPDCVLCVLCESTAF
jgi:hypothetical protein